ncbi:hypothetical protein CP532_0421 [Ophiocordyceps camponoti-leonardi (nom. inval.)]|nr:hypothetical protein CP532_0421 [Ophiocordyceps camponoti-leonardi (nom. inval.)]
MKCSAALSVLALAIAATAAPLDDNRNFGGYDDRIENKGFEAKGYESKSYEAKGYEAKGYDARAYDNGYHGRGRDYERGLEGYHGPGYGYGPDYGYGKGRAYKRAVQDKQAGYDRHWAPYHGRDYDDYNRHDRYDPTGDYEDNFNGNSRDTIVGNRGDTNGNRGDNCSAKSQQQVCCNGGLSCLVQVHGQACETNAYCCDTHSAPGTAVNLNLLNCLSLH